MSKILSELKKKHSHKQLDKIKKSGQIIKKKFNKQVEILKNQIEILEMKRSISKNKQTNNKPRWKVSPTALIK